MGTSFEFDYLLGSHVEWVKGGKIYGGVVKNITTKGGIYFFRIHNLFMFDAKNKTWVDLHSQFSVEGLLDDEERVLRCRSGRKIRYQMIKEPEAYVFKDVINHMPRHSLLHIVV